VMPSFGEACASVPQWFCRLCVSRVGHGLDASMDWIGLGRMLEKLGWIGLDWIAANG